MQEIILCKLGGRSVLKGLIPPQLAAVKWKPHVQYSGRRSPKVRKYSKPVPGRAPS